jgi:hypothetical protein
MIEVFITDIQNNIQAYEILKKIQKDNTDLKINFDLNETDFPFPCGHTVLRVEAIKINLDNIMATLKNQGFNCEIMEDKICK